MKKIFCLVLILISLFLVSCGESSVPIVYTTPIATAETVGTFGTISTAIEQTTTATDDKSGEATSTTSIQMENPTVNGKKFNNGKYHSPLNKSVETSSKVLIGESLLYMPALYYYSKADGEFYPFCFDPLCNHLDKSKCIGAMMIDPQRAVNASEIYYINSRFYFVAYQKIYSCSEFATDLRVELTLDSKVGSFTSDGNYLLFMCLDAGGNIIQYAFDTGTKKLTDMRIKMKEKENELGVMLYTHSFENGKVYIGSYSSVQNASITGKLNVYVEGDFEGWYVADYDFKTFSKTDRVPNVSYDFTTDYGNVEIIFKNTEKTEFDVVHHRFDGTDEMIAEGIALEKMPISLYMTDNSYYFWCNDPIDVGIDPYYFEGKIPRPNSCGGKLYRLDLKTGKIQTVFDNIAYDVFKIFYIDEDDQYGFMKLQKYTVNNENVSTKGGLLYQFRLDENGNIVDLEKVEFE